MTDVRTQHELNLNLGVNPNFACFVAPSRPPKPVDSPYAASISAGKNTYVYDAHTYHTKVPPEGIEKLIDYYTLPGQVVLDPFCGSGMTGIAAANLGRKALLSDLSPAAVFIARNLNLPAAAVDYRRAFRRILSEAEALEHRLYDTTCRRCGHLTPMLYLVWSYKVICPACDMDFSLWDVARDERANVRESKIRSEFDCPHCGRHLKKRGIKRTIRVPVQVGYKCCSTGMKESTAAPNEEDLRKIEQIEHEGLPADLWYPTDRFPAGLNTRQPAAAGINRVDQAYTTRALFAMAYLWDAAVRWPDDEMREKILLTITSLYQRVTVFSEFRFWGGSGNTANYNVPFIMNEQNVFRAFDRKAKTILLYFRSARDISREVEVSTQSACHLDQLPDGSIDYIFTDPPFGGNINYSEMNFLWESWLGVRTDTREEAIINAVQRKGVDQYGEILCAAFTECRRVLKHGAWMTVVFHNSSDRVWKSLQESLRDAGFCVQGTQTFDKKHGTFKQFVSDNAVGYDLVVHCQKSPVCREMTEPTPEELSTRAAEFVHRRLSEAGDHYLFHYLHVDRQAEIDYRKLYAEWLTTEIPKAVISLGFEAFRAVAERALQGVIPKADQGRLF